MDQNFTIEQTNIVSFEDFGVRTNVPEFLGLDAQAEASAYVLELEDALQIAIRQSRAYQLRKEQLYLEGLSLAFARHEFTPIFSGSADAAYVVDTIEREFIVGTNALGEVIVTDRIVEDSRVEGGGTIRVDWLIRDVGRLTAAFTADFFRFFTGNSRVGTSSRLVAEVSRPLLRNAGFKAEEEALIQAERDLLYALRNFTQFRKDFSVGVARDYYSILGRRDIVRNSFLNLESSRRNAERVRAMVAEGRNTTAELGRLGQQELNAESSWINAIRTYKQELDEFKIALGLSVDANIVLDDQELEKLEIQHPELDVEDAIQIALAARLDYMNAKDSFEDSERNVELRQNFLKPRLDFAASMQMNSRPGDSSHLAFPDPSRYAWEAGLALDPDFDRTSERNDYRRALIVRDAAARNVELQEDEIKLSVREGWRALEQAKRNYEISELGVRLAERRVEEQDLLAEVGRARAQDQVDAQNDLINARNELTRALVAHTIARLEFWNSMGILYIKDDGQWEEIQNAKAN